MQESNSNTDSQQNKRYLLDNTASVRDLYLKNCKSKKYKSLVKSREELPVFQYESAILEKLRKHNVILIAGETGCGKSTQIPHYILKVGVKCLKFLLKLCSVGYEPVHEKTNNLGFRPGPTQTRLNSHRIVLEA